MKKWCFRKTKRVTLRAWMTTFGIKLFFSLIKALLPSVTHACVLIYISLPRTTYKKCIVLIHRNLSFFSFFFARTWWHIYSSAPVCCSHRRSLGSYRRSGWCFLTPRRFESSEDRMFLPACLRIESNSLSSSSLISHLGFTRWIKHPQKSCLNANILTYYNAIISITIITL